MLSFIPTSGTRCKFPAQTPSPKKRKLPIPSFSQEAPPLEEVLARAGLSKQGVQHLENIFRRRHTPLCPKSLQTFLLNINLQKCLLFWDREALFCFRDTCYDRDAVRTRQPRPVAYSHANVEQRLLHATISHTGFRVASLAEHEALGCNFFSFVKKNKTRPEIIDHPNSSRMQPAAVQ